MFAKVSEAQISKYNGNQNLKFTKKNFLPKFLRKLALIHQKGQLEALITMHASKLEIQTTSWEKLGSKLKNFAFD